jgi:hypothetical protein
LEGQDVGVPQPASATLECDRLPGSRCQQPIRVEPHHWNGGVRSPCWPRAEARISSGARAQETLTADRLEVQSPFTSRHAKPHRVAEGVAPRHGAMTSEFSAIHTSVSWVSFAPPASCGTAMTVI